MRCSTIFSGIQSVRPVAHTIDCDAKMALDASRAIDRREIERLKAEIATLQATQKM
jgi:hypothetical protein